MSHWFVHTEYCCIIWNSYTTKYISKVENIQRQAARFVVNNYRRRESVTAMLHELDWTSLESRRKAVSLILLYRIFHQQVAVNPAHYLTPMAPSPTRSYHPLKYQTISSHIQLYQYSFFPRTVNWWHSLGPTSYWWIIPSNDVDAHSGHYSDN